MDFGGSGLDARVCCDSPLWPRIQCHFRRTDVGASTSERLVNLSGGGRARWCLQRGQEEVQIEPANGVLDQRLIDGDGNTLFARPDRPGAVWMIRCPYSFSLPPWRTRESGHLRRLVYGERNASGITKHYAGRGELSFGSDDNID